MFSVTKSGHPTEGCTLGKAFIVLEQGNARVLADWVCSVTTSCSLSMLSGVFVGHVTLCTLCLAPYCGKCLKIVYPPIPSHYMSENLRCDMYKGFELLLEKVRCLTFKG